MVVSLVDLPDLPVAAVRRVLDAPGDRRRALRRAVHDGRPGHPVLVGRVHWGAAGGGAPRGPRSWPLPAVRRRRAGRVRRPVGRPRPRPAGTRPPVSRAWHGRREARYHRYRASRLRR
ncbi:hypothetical protein [Curtobacterium sp. MCJR17_043]|uniref:hypothetical protein n=1 Tax=Curtobacterium sp. MCJR17_043 TaxID=2175660 RepID=UPI0032E8E75A